MVLAGVVAYRGIDWKTCFLIGCMIPLIAVMTKTGAPGLIADTLIHFLGNAGPRKFMAGLFVGLFVVAALTGCVVSFRKQSRQ
jgi:di/tricarboxylate transporter